MVDGMNKGIEAVAELGNNIEKAAIKAGYGKTLNADSVQKLVDSVVRFQEEETELIAQYRREATDNASEIEKIVEDGKKRSYEAKNKYAIAGQEKSAE